jgi:hypothetical protein
VDREEDSALGCSRGGAEGKDSLVPRGEEDSGTESRRRRLASVLLGDGSGTDSLNFEGVGRAGPNAGL